jgi:hypothetical protein
LGLHNFPDITDGIYGRRISGEGKDGLEDALRFERNPDEKSILLHIAKQKSE